MEEQLLSLIQLQELDAKIRTHLEQQNRLPDILAALERRHAAINENVDKAKEALLTAQKNKRDRDNDLAAGIQKVEKLKARSSELKRIIKVLPEAATFCPHLLTSGGYDNVFEEEEPGLFSIDVTDDGLCLFAYRSNHRIHCSLHSVAMKLGLPLAQVKPKVCLLWPMHFTEGVEVLAIMEDAFLFPCNVRKAARSRSLSPGFVEAINQVYGEGCGVHVENAAEQGERRTLLVIRK